MWFLLLMSCGRVASEAEPARVAPPEPAPRAVRALVASGPPLEATHLQLSADGRYVAVGDAEGRVQVWHVATQLPVLRSAPTGSPVRALAFDGRVLRSSHADGSHRAHDLVTGATEPSVERAPVRPSAPATGAIPLPESERVVGAVDGPGSTVIALTDAGALVAWNPAEPEAPVRRVAPGAAMHPVIAAAPESGAIAVAEEGGAIQIRGAHALSLMSVLGPSPWATVTAVGEGHGRLAVGLGTGAVRQFDLDTGLLVQRTSGPADTPIRAIAVGPSHLTAFATDGEIRLIHAPPNVKEGDVHSLLSVSPEGDGPVELSFEADHFVVTEDGMERRWVVNEAAAAPWDPEAAGPALPHAPLPEVPHAWPARDGGVRFVDPETGGERGRLYLGGGPRSRNWLAIAADGRFQVWMPRASGAYAGAWAAHGHVVPLYALRGDLHVDGLISELMGGWQAAGVTPPTDLGAWLAERGEPDASSSTHYVQASTLIVREAPGAAPVGRLAINTPLEIVGQERGFAEIRPAGSAAGPQGWVPREFLSPRPITADQAVTNAGRARFAERVDWLERAAALAPGDRGLMVVLAEAYASVDRRGDARQLLAGIADERPEVAFAPLSGGGVGYTTFWLPGDTGLSRPWAYEPGPIDMAVAQGLGLVGDGGEGRPVWALPISGPPIAGRVKELRRIVFGSCGQENGFAVLLHLPEQPEHAEGARIVAWTLEEPPARWREAEPAPLDAAELKAAEAAARASLAAPLPEGPVSAVRVDDGVRLRIAVLDEPADPGDEIVPHYVLHDFLVHDGGEVHAFEPSHPHAVIGEDVPALIGSRDVDGDGRLDVIVANDCVGWVERAETGEVLFRTTDRCCYC